MAERFRAAVAAMSVLLVLSSAYLTLALIILNPPRANFRHWLAVAAIFTTQSVLTLIAVKTAHPPAALRLLVRVGACCLIGIAVWRVRDTLASSHFEGYNLLLGAIILVQSGLTLASVARGGHNAPGTTA
jgi:hypothetical protein